MTGGLGQRLEALRKRAGISQQRMAAELSVTQEDVSAVESGTRVFARPKYISDCASVTGDDDQEQTLLSLWRESAP
jgi:transcriptional regulator with XRE-family HTH domain